MKKVFDFVNGVVAVVAIISALAIDSISWTPCIVFAGCLAWYILWLKIESVFGSKD